MFKPSTKESITITKRLDEANSELLVNLILSGEL